jgi:two-component system chemotaxis sensor kinase CheA
LPFLRIRRAFGLGGEAGARENIVVVQYGGQKIGLVVDSLQGEFQTVIKPLGKLFSGLKGFGGFTILGSGEVALILDVPALLQSMIEGKREHVAGGQRSGASTVDMTLAA